MDSQQHIFIMYLIISIWTKTIKRIINMLLDVCKKNTEIFQKGHYGIKSKQIVQLFQLKSMQSTARLGRLMIHEKCSWSILRANIVFYRCWHVSSMILWGRQGFLKSYICSIIRPIVSIYTICFYVSWSWRLCKRC